MDFPKRAFAAALSLALVFSGPGISFAQSVRTDDQRPAIKAAFVTGEPLPPSTRTVGEVYEQAADLQKGPRADEVADSFSARIDAVAEKLALDADECAKVKALYSKRRRPAGESREAASRAIDEQAERQIAAKAAAARLAAGLGTGPAPQDLGDGVGGATGGVVRRDDRGALIARLNAQAVPSKGLVTHDVPENENVDVLHALGDLAVAPPPTLRMRYDAAFSDKQTVAQDLSTVRSRAGTLELPADGHTGLASSQASLDEFVSWVKAVPAGELPNIGYGVLDAGEIGRYERNMLRKSAITINISVKDAEPEARAAVLFHELYHYWDVEVAKNRYANVSYGFIDPAHMPEHELDAYYLTALMWSQSKPDQAKSPLAQFLGRLPTNRDEVQAMVETSLGQIKK